MPPMCALSAQRLGFKRLKVSCAKADDLEGYITNALSEQTAVRHLRLGQVRAARAA